MDTNSGQNVRKRKPVKEYMKKYRERLRHNPGKNAELKGKDRKRKQLSRAKEKVLLSETTPHTKTLLAAKKKKERDRKRAYRWKSQWQKVIAMMMIVIKLIALVLQIKWTHLQLLHKFTQLSKLLEKLYQDLRSIYHCLLEEEKQ